MFGGEDGYGMGGCMGMAALAEDDFTSGGTSPGYVAGEEVELDGPGGIMPGLKSFLGGGKTARVTAPNGVKLRSGPSENTAMLALVPLNTVVDVLEEGFPPTPAASRGWSKVKSGGRDGFVTNEWIAISSAPFSPFGPSPLSPTPPPAAPPPPAPLPMAAPPPPPRPTPAAASIVPQIPGVTKSTSKWIWIGGAIVLVLGVGAVALGGGKD